MNHINNKVPYFDSRVCNVPQNFELVNNLMWRSSYDNRRNSIFGVSQLHYSKNELKNVNTKKQLVLLSAKGINWNDFPDAYKYGTFSKRELYQEGEQTRTRVVSKSREISNTYSEEEAKWLLSKYWETS